MRLEEAIQSSFAYERHDGAILFRKSFDKSWAMGQAPHGGLALCAIVVACEQFQQRRQHEHVDCMYLSAFFYVPTPLDTIIDIIVKPKRKTKSFTYLSAEMRVQNSQQLTIEADLIFGVLPAFADTEAKNIHSPTLVYPARGSRRIPFHTPSNDCKEVQQPLISKFQDEMLWRRDPVVQEKTDRFMDGKGDECGMPGLRSATWIELRDKAPLASRHVPIFLDMFESMPDMILGQTKSWHPTLALTLNVFCRLPEWDHQTEYQSNELGVFAFGANMRNGRHESMTEVWTSPRRDARDANWRDKQQCIASSTQLALTLPVKRQKGRL